MTKHMYEDAQIIAYPRTADRNSSIRIELENGGHAICPRNYNVVVDAYVVGYGGK